MTGLAELLVPGEVSSPPCPSCDASLRISHPTEQVAVWHIEHAPACPYVRQHNRTARRALRRRGGQR